jgi:hypothetical protein
MKDEFEKLFVHATRSFIDVNPHIFATKSEHPARTALVDPASGKKESCGRYVVRFRISRVRPLDQDNAFGGVKSCVDLLVGSGILPSDSPETLKIEVEQEKVAHRRDQRTEITVIWPNK